MNFKQAVPVWGQGLETEKNITLGFVTPCPAAADGVLRVATSGFYRVFVNGVFVFYGPVRCAHGHFRVDEIPLGGWLTQPENHVAVEVVNYYVTGYGALQQPGFIRMELEAGGAILAATGSWQALRLTERVRKMQRYSFQRPFAESYHLHPDTYAWRVGGVSPDAAAQPTEETAAGVLLPRELALHSFPTVAPERVLSRGRLTVGALPDNPKRDRSLLEIREEYHGFPLQELELIVTDEIQRFRYEPLQPADAPYSGCTRLTAGEQEILALPGERTGFPAMDIRCAEKTMLWFLFDEVLTPKGEVDALRMGCANAIRLELEPGTYHFQGMEPVGFRYFKLVCTEGAAKVTDFQLVEVAHPLDTAVTLSSDDPREQAVFRAAWQTFRQNAADLFTDCPTRERAGWLCDSYFIGRSAQFFTDDTRMERQFLENFLLNDRFAHLPEGMLPMCYPSDHVDGCFILNWALWYVAELWDYRQRTGDEALVQQAKPAMERLYAYLKTVENADGLLHHLPSWAFVEWSDASDYVQDINYPTNMTYAYAQRALGALYHDADATARGEALTRLIRERSFNGEFFIDNEVYNEQGVPVRTENCSETCQYHAFFFGIATPESHPALWKTLTTEFGPRRQELGLYPHVRPANAFTGNFLRLESLLRFGEYDRCREEVTGYFAELARRTGTLWEMMTATASCNHGFASYAACLLHDAITRRYPYAQLGAVPDEA